MKTIRFLEAAVYETEGPKRGVNYAAGQIVDLRDDLADRWVRRGVAVYHQKTNPAGVSEKIQPAGTTSRTVR